MVQPRHRHKPSPPHSVDAEAYSTLPGLECLAADFCRPLEGLSARPSALSDALLGWSGGQEAGVRAARQEGLCGVPLPAVWPGPACGGAALESSAGLTLRHSGRRPRGQSGQPGAPRGRPLSAPHPDGPGDVAHDFLPACGRRVGRVHALRGQCRDDCSSAVRGQALKGGSSTVLQTPGRHGQSPPHLPLLAPSGGDEGQGERWEHSNDLPYARLRRKGPWPLLRRVGQTLQTAAIHPWVDPCCRPSPHGLVTNVQQGAVPSQSQSWARSVAQDGVSPPLAVRRLERDAGVRGTAHDRSQRTERGEQEPVAVETFSGRMVQHTVPQGCKHSRSYGGQATKTFAQGKVARQAALATVEGVVQGAVKSIARLTYRQRDQKSTGRAPLRCPPWRGEMGLWRLWHPT